MSALRKRRVLLGICGGIAAYKAAELTRRLKEAGAEVRVIITRGGQEFITPLTLQALSGNPVHTELLDEEAELGMGHIELAKWADLLLIAPATANIIAQIATGKADDLLSTVVLATEATVAIAPAMNQAMWNNSSTQQNIDTLAKRNLLIWGPGQGEQACGDMGFGRLLEVDQLVELCEAQYLSLKMAGKRVVITAGPTREAIDPVRYISNHSSGKMGFAIARAAAEAGADVTIVAGPVMLATPDRCRRIDVESCEQMYAATLSECKDADLFIATAAVADYRPQQALEHKIKKSAEIDQLQIQLIKNPDILGSVAEMSSRPFCVGFAAETQNIESYARSKLERKGLDLIAANDVSDVTIGFNSDINTVTLISQEYSEVLGPSSKLDIGKQLIDRITSAMEHDKGKQ